MELQEDELIEVDTLYFTNERICGNDYNFKICEK